MTTRLFILLAAIVVLLGIWHHQRQHQEKIRHEFEITERMLDLTNDISDH